MRHWIPETLSVTAFALTACLEASAQTSATLTERIENAMKQEPTWQLTQRFGPPVGGSLEPGADARWEYAGGAFTVVLRVYKSSLDAEKAVNQHNESRASSAGTLSASYGDLGFRTASPGFPIGSPSFVQVLFQKHNVLVLVSGPYRSSSQRPIAADPLRGVSMSEAHTPVDRAARVVEAAISAHVTVTSCVDELLSDARPAPRTADERLFRAAERGCVTDVLAALKSGASPNAGNDQESSLFTAARRLHVEVVRGLLNAGADPTNKNASAALPPIWAILRAPSVCCSSDRPYSRLRDDRLAIIDALIGAGADINASFADGQTVFLEAMRNSYYNDRPFLEGLLARGANPHVRTKSGDTALTTLLSSTNPSQWAERMDRITLLLETGVDVNAKNHEGKTALEIVQSRVHPPGTDVSSVVRVLIAAGAK